MKFEEIISELKKKIYHPVYFLQGEEPYYIDVISDYIEKNILSASEKEFNQTVLYGKETDILTLISYARRYPMMSSHQVIIVKEAQDLKYFSAKEKKEDKDNKDPFLDYIQKPTASTILVFCYKYKSLDKRTKIAKAIDKSAVLYSNKKLYENELPNWINEYVMKHGFRINPRASAMMAEYLGNDLSKIANETGKLLISMKAGEEITVSMVEENIGISKEFNVFELQNALGKRNIYKANQIVNYMGANTKNNPMVMTTAQLYSFFLKILTYHQLPDRNSNSAASALGVHPYFLKDYETAAKSYPLPVCIRNISLIHECDLRTKGVNNASANDGSLLKELVYKILH